MGNENTNAGAAEGASKKGGFRFSLTLKLSMVAITPIVVLSIVLIFVGARAIREATQTEVIGQLESSVQQFKGYADAEDEGDYSLDADNNLLKGKYNITENSDKLDEMVEGQELDVTFIFDKTRRATTLINAETGDRNIGTEIGDEAYNATVKGGKEFVSTDLKIGDKDYYAVYQPMKNSDGTVVGAVFVGKNVAEVKQFISNKRMTLILVAVVIAIVAALLVLILVRLIGKAIGDAKAVINELATGNLGAAKIPEKLLARGDEVGDIAREVNSLQTQMISVIGQVHEASKTLSEAGEELSNLAANTSGTADEIGHAVEDISTGAVSQAEEIENASADIAQMGGIIKKIVDGMVELDNTSGEMKEAGDQSTTIIKDLSASNDKTMDAIGRIATQVNATNESANKISEAINLITSIAEETNLLSLNASIEAARAGEQGRGFAVVANQIQKLAEQSNESAMKVSEIIDNLLKDSEKTVAVMEEVEEIIGEQARNLDRTRAEFSNVQSGINSSREETSEIKEQTNVCDDARVRVVDVISNLSAISQENAAATQETTASMQELNATINLLAASASNLTDLSSNLEQQIQFFKL